jgi:hypothetical protein
MARKAFFKERTVNQIQKLDCKVVDNPVGLVEKIENLDPENEGLILDFPLAHPDYKDEDLQYASRKTMRGVKRKGKRRTFPSYIQLRQPRSKEEAIKAHGNGVFPFKIRNQAFFEKMENIPEEENFFVGYMVWPITGDMSPIMVPFWSLAEGCMMDAYNRRICKGENGSKIERIYGPDLIMKVPSREKKASRYVLRVNDIPHGSMSDKDRAVVGWNTRPSYGVIRDGEFVQDESAAPGHKLPNLSHEGSHRSGEDFKFTMLYPHCDAANQEIIRQFMGVGDLKPFEMSQLAVLSREDASFYNKERNNLLVYELNENGECVLRHPRIDQKSMLFARRVGNNIRTLEHIGDIQETMYWDPERDGKISQYPFLPGER